MAQKAKTVLQSASPYNAAITREQFLFYEVRTTAKLLCEGLSADEVAERIVPANSLVEYRMLLDRWRTADGTAKSSGITDSIRAAAVAEVEAVAEALRLSPFGLDEKGRVAERKMLKRMESNERYVVVRLCVANQIQYLGRVSSLKEFEEYRECCGFEKSDIAVQDWKPAG